MNPLHVKKAIKDAEAFKNAHGDFGLPSSVLTMMCYVNTLISADMPIETTISVYSDPFSDDAGDNAHSDDAMSTYLSQIPGKRITATIAAQALKLPTDIGSLRDIGQQLRRLCGEPKRSNGRIVFNAPGHDVPPPSYKPIPGSVFLPAGDWEQLLQYARSMGKPPLSGLLTMSEITEQLALRKPTELTLDRIRECLRVRNILPEQDMEEEAYFFE